MNNMAYCSIHLSEVTMILKKENSGMKQSQRTNITCIMAYRNHFRKRFVDTCFIPVNTAGLLSFDLN